MQSPGKSITLTLRKCLHLCRECCMHDRLGFILSKQDGKLERSPSATPVVLGDVQEEEPTFFFSPSTTTPTGLGGGENKFQKYK